MRGGDVDLGDLAFQARPGVEEDAPAEPGDALAVAYSEDDVLALEGGWHVPDRLVQVVPTQLRVIGVEGLLVLVELQQQWAHEVVLGGQEALHVGIGQLAQPVRVPSTVCSMWPGPQPWIEAGKSGTVSSM